MSATRLTYSGVLEVTTCWCGVPHAIPSDLMRQANQTGLAVFCPLGHKWVVGKTEAQELREKLEAAQRTVIRERNWRASAERDTEAERRSKAAVRGHLTRMRNKVTNGVCPVPSCRRHFDNVQAHLAGEHAGWLEAHDIELDAI